MPIRCALFENSATAIPDTVENLKRNGGRVLVVEAGRTSWTATRWRRPPSVWAW